MAKEEEHPSFYCVLSDALNDRMLLSSLLDHAKFQNQGRQICYRVAGRENGEDLFQEACLWVLNKGELNSEKIQSERDFFNWFSAVARKLYFEEMRKMAGMKSCIEKTMQWPGALADVSSNDIDEFLRHADVCPYHMEILRAEEEEIRSVFLQARGLDSHGRILCGSELQAAIAEHGRRSKIWKEAARRKELPFNCIALYNDGKEIARCGKFFDLSKHSSLHQLNPRAGLQIRGIGGIHTEEDVLLGFYALAGVCHDKDKEHLLDLDNGYTVGLKIKQLGEENFEVHFRCVETRVIEEEQARASADVNRETMAGEAGAVPFADSLALKPGGWWPPPISWQAGAIYGTLSALLFVAISVSALLLAGTLAKNVNANNKHASTSPSDDRNSEAIATQESQGLGKVNGQSDKGISAQSQTKSRLKKSAASASPRQPKPSPPDAAEARSERPEAKSPRVPASDSNTQPSSDNVAFRPPQTDTKVIHIPKPDPTPLQLVFSAHKTWSTNNLAQSAFRRANFSTANMTWPDTDLVLLTINYPSVGNKVFREIQRKNHYVKVVEAQSLPPTKYKIDFFVLPWEAEGAQTSVLLRVTISLDGDHIGGSPLSYKGVGKSLDLAYENAVGKAIPTVIDKINNLHTEPQSAFVNCNDEFEVMLCHVPGRVGFSHYQTMVSTATPGGDSAAGNYAGDKEAGPNANESRTNTPQNTEDGWITH